MGVYNGPERIATGRVNGSSGCARQEIEKSRKE
jgi:hypothetical protein